MQEIMRLEATLVEPEKGIQSNISALQAQCLDMAGEMRGARPIHTPEEYKEAKAMRAAVRKAAKQVDDERKRVKVAWTAPLTRFEASVKGALAPLSEVEGEWDRAIKDYEARARAAKRERLQAYWEEAYPALALCVEGEPLVPFDRASACVEKELRNMSEAGEGRDPVAFAKLDELAAHLAEGARAIASLSEPQEVREDALSRLYASFNVVEAISEAKREHSRRESMRALSAAQAETGVPAVEPAPEPMAEPDPVTPDAESPSEGYQMPEKGSFEPVGYICIPVLDRGHMEAVISVMKHAGISGTFKRAYMVRFMEVENDG